MLSALGDFIARVVPGVQIVVAQQNRVPMPNANFIALTPLHSIGLSTNRETWGIDSISNSRSTEWRCQIDCYGDNAETNAVAISTMVRTATACELIPRDVMQPLYCTDPKNIQFINGQQQYEVRFTFDFVAQYNPVVTIKFPMFNAINVDLKEVDTYYPPGVNNANPSK